MSTEYRSWSLLANNETIYGSWTNDGLKDAQAWAAHSKACEGVLDAGVESRVKERTIEFWGESVYTFSEWLALPDEEIAAIFQRCSHPQDVKRHLQPLLDSTEYAFAQQPTEENLERLRKAFKSIPATD